MNKQILHDIHLTVLVTVFFFMCTIATAQDKVVVIPLDVTVGNATTGDVVKGRTFSSQAAGTEAVGTLVLPPTAQTFTNSIGMSFNLIPAGTFNMGSPSTEPGRGDGETQHEVTLTQSFYMQTTEVTQAQWEAIVTQPLVGGVNPSQSNTGDNYPVEYVNWYEAASFANWLSVSEGLTPCYNGNGTCTGTLGDDFSCTDVTIDPSCTGYRLPTEAEWEYAARATTTTAYANPVNFDATNEETQGGFNSNLHAMGWYIYNNTLTDYGDGSKPVAQKQANSWGLYDMHGNVMEWCRDLWDGSDYAATPVTDPLGDASGSNRVVRGGSYGFFARHARSAYRDRYWQGSHSYYLGFRLVLSSGQ